MKISCLRQYFFGLCLFLTSLLSTTNFFHRPNLNQALAEIVNIQNEEKSFGDWKVFCETDVMMSISHCRIASKFYENTAAISIEPTGKFFSQLLVIIPQIKVGSFVKIRIDQNDLILSQNVDTKDFGLIPLSETQKQNLFQQMKAGDFLYLRFSVRGSDKEITIKINLQDFRNALNYRIAKTSSKSSAK